MGARLLITGFGSFPGIATNPSEALITRLRAVPPPVPEGTTCAFHVLPVTWAMLDTELAALHRDHAPHAIMHFGVAGRRRLISVETRARNAATTVNTDAAGHIRNAARLQSDGPDSRRATLNAAPLLAALDGAGLPARRSRDAGDYLCNATLWASLAAGFAATFIHVPQTGDKSGLSLDDLERGARALIATMAAQAVLLSPAATHA